jgi:alkyl sulfatase BDS1-like metallo-beta-lactamase superfamily hydrolase
MMTFNRISLVLSVAALTTMTCSLAFSQDDFGHFHPKGKPPSEHTLKMFEEARQSLPFADRQDFEEWERGFIARREDLKIMADAGNVAWDMERYLFLDEPDKINSVHPSMLRISELNNNYGLYEVIPGIYQVRGFDLANVTFVRGKTGWILAAFAAS